VKRFLSLFFVIILLIPSFCCSGSNPDVPKIKSEIQSILDCQKAEWNDKNIEGFMEDYWKSENFTFQSGNNRLHGWDALLSRYKKSFTGENWGELDFIDIEIKVLTNEHAYVLGRWKLTYKDSSKEGLFTIIFKRMTEGWKIIHDHSS